MARAWRRFALTSTEIDRPLARQTRHLCVLHASARTKLLAYRAASVRLIHWSNSTGHFDPGSSGGR